MLVQFQRATKAEAGEPTSNPMLTCETLGWLRRGWMFSVTRFSTGRREDSGHDKDDWGPPPWPVGHSSVVLGIWSEALKDHSHSLWPLAVVSEQDTYALSLSNMVVINVGVSLQCEGRTNDVSSWQESGHRVNQPVEDTGIDEKHDRNNLAGLTFISTHFGVVLCFSFL